jgi:uncharacterized protein YndB with AHSA1/START domain
MIQQNYLCSRQITISRNLPGSTRTVWEYLTQANRLEAWLGVGEIRCRGERFELVQNGETVPFQSDGYICGEVLEREDDRYLACTWKHVDPGYCEEDVEESMVEFSIVQEGTSVTLTLCHSGLGREEKNSVMATWNAHLNYLADQMMQRELQPVIFYLERLEEAKHGGDGVGGEGVTPVISPKNYWL